MSRDFKRITWIDQPLQKLRRTLALHTFARITSLALALLVLVGCGTPAATPVPLPPAATSPPVSGPATGALGAGPAATLIPTVTPRPTPTPTVTPVPGSATCTTYQPAGIEGPIWDIEVAPSGDVWVAAYRGVARLELSTGEWMAYTQEDGLPDDQALSITAGPGLSVWLPLRDSNGVAHFDGSSWTHYTTKDGLPSDDVHNVSVAPDGSIWFATADGALRWNRELNTWAYYTTLNGLYDNGVERVLFTPDGRIWFAHFGALTSFLPASSRGEEDTWTTYSGPRFLTARKAVLSRDGRLWVGRVFYDPDEQEWVDTVYRDIHIQGLAVDSEGGLWIARKDGALYLPDPVSGPRESWRGYGLPQGLAGDDLFVITLQSDWVVWFGTRDGLSRCVLG